jgi:hypothetical protein
MIVYESSWSVAGSIGGVHRIAFEHGNSPYGINLTPE